MSVCLSVLLNQPQTLIYPEQKLHTMHAHLYKVCNHASIQVCAHKEHKTDRTNMTNDKTNDQNDREVTEVAKVMEVT